MLRVNNRIQGNMPANHSLQRLLTAVRDNLGIDRTIAFEDAEDLCLAADASAALALDSAR